MLVGALEALRKPGHRFHELYTVLLFFQPFVDLQKWDDGFCVCEVLRRRYSIRSKSFWRRAAALVECGDKPFSCDAFGGDFSIHDRGGHRHAQYRFCISGANNTMHTYSEISI